MKSLLVLFFTVLFAMYITTISSCNSGGGGQSSQDTVVNGDTIAKVLLHTNEIDSSVIATFFKVNVPTMNIHKNIVVPAGGSILVDGSPVAYDGLTMGANSTIIISPKLTSCSLILTGAVFDDNVKIVADNVPGAAGSNGIQQTAEAVGGKNGQLGFAGGDGGRGANGIDMVIKAGFVRVANLTVSAKGGSGGNGGNGGNGQKGADAGCGTTGSGNGGQGGKAGNGGNGGSNGNIDMTYYFENGTNPTPGKIELLMDFANGGNPGLPGPGGGGGAGNNCKTGPITRGIPHSGSPAGPLGATGRVGSAGQVGKNTLTGPHGVNYKSM